MSETFQQAAKRMDRYGRSPSFEHGANPKVEAKPRPNKKTEVRQKQSAVTRQARTTAVTGWTKRMSGSLKRELAISRFLSSVKGITARDIVVLAEGNNSITFGCEYCGKAIKAATAGEHIRGCKAHADLYELGELGTQEIDMNRDGMPVCNYCGAPAEGHFDNNEYECPVMRTGDDLWEDQKNGRLVRKSI